MPFGRSYNYFSLLPEGSLSRRVLIAFLSLVVIYGLSILVAPSPALAVNCDVNACISQCQKNNPQGAAGRTCNSGCMLRIEDLKKKGQWLCEQ
jgi:hypothetical protein